MRKKFLRIIAGITAFLIIGLLLVLANESVGNPVTSAIATAKMREYVQEHFPGQDITVTRARYSPKFSVYVAKAQSKTSPDTYFEVFWRKGNISDRYDSVQRGYTTYSRLEQEFNQAIEEIINAEFPYQVNLLIAGFTEHNGDLSSLILDMALDIHNPPMSPYITVWTDSHELSFTVLAERMLELHELMKSQNIPIQFYSLLIEIPVERGEEARQTLAVYDFPAEQIVAEGLAESLEEHKKEMDARETR